MLDRKTHYTTENSDQTEQIGHAVADALLSAGNKSAFVALFGDMGAGKTAFARGFTARLSPAAAVRSPTYTIVNEYRGGILPVFHFDMYRVTDEEDLFSTGFWDYLAMDGYCICEWSENISYALPASYIKVVISKMPDCENHRIITTEPVSQSIS